MRYPSNNADFFNTGDFNTNTNNANKNTFSVENTNNAVNTNTNSNNLHQRKSSSSMPSSSSMNALPTHMRNRSSGGFAGGSGNTPTTINFGSSSSATGAGQTTPPTNFATASNQRQPSLGFDNTTTFLGGTTNSTDFGTNGNVNSSDLFGGGVVNNNTTSTNNNFNNNNQVAMGRQQSSNIDSFDEENEPPLLEELGIRPDHIRDKVKLVLNPFSQVTSSHELCMDEDLAGPITFVVALGFLLTLQGKVHFGAIYGTSVVGILLSYFLLTMMSREVPVRTTLVVSTLGYCLLPDLLLAIFVTLHLAFVGGGSVGVFLPVLCFVTVSWSAWCAMKIFAEAFQLHHARYLILYPSFLFYAVFAAITMF